MEKTMIPFIDLKKQQERIREKIEKRIMNILDHGKYIMGPEIMDLEGKLADYVGVKHCISCSSGTDALLMPLMARGIGKGDAVFTTPFTFIATAEVISLLGATPIFVDINSRTFNVDPDELVKAINRVKKEGVLKPSAIIPVDLFGLPADYTDIERIAVENELFLLEDAAQGFGGSISDRKSCSFGNVAATSFFPAKPLGCYGDGGAIFTDDDKLADILKSIRVHGKGTEKYDNIRIGMNGRLDTIQAAILLEKLSIFDDELKAKNIVAMKYTEKLKDLVITPEVPDEYVSAWAQYSVLAKDSNERTIIQTELKKQGIPSAIYYPKPLHMQTAFSSLYSDMCFEISEDMSKRIFSLPMHAYLSNDDIDSIAGIIEKTINK
jgi:UDP-2-acetamido-2-deoxy-ribo-hexuluronate aminotransferase